MKTIRSFRFKPVSAASVLALAAAAMVPGQAFAADAPQSSGSAATGSADNGSVLIQDIVVTANKRQEKLQNVGIAATAFNATTLAQLGINTTNDLAKMTPALNINYANPSVAQINIRGVSQNDFADHLETPIAVYWDEGYVGSSMAIATPTYDIQRVEVLRGPQGTLFGRNATGGLIHYISAAPTDTLSGYMEASYGRFNTYNIQGALSGPLAEGIRARIAFTRNSSDGPYYNIVTGRHDVGNTRNWAVRGQIEADLGPDTKLNLIGSYNNDDQAGAVWPFEPAVTGANGLGTLLGSNQIGTWSNLVLGGTISSCAGCNLVGYKPASSNPWVVASNDPGYYLRDIYKGQAKLTQQFGSTSLTVISDYLKVDNQKKYDTDSSPQNFFTYSADGHYKQFSQELRLNGTNGALKWVAGLYYLNMRGYYTQPLDLDFGVFVGNPLCSGLACGVSTSTIPVHFEPRYTVDVDSYAEFAQGEYQFSPELSFTGGLRYTTDVKRFHYQWSDTEAFVPVVDYADREVFRNVAAKAQLDWRPIDGTLLYLSYTRGHKGGNWAAPAFPPITPSTFPYKQEVLTSYETGMKTRLFGKLATLNTSAYYYDYKNYQAFSLLGLSQSITNKNATVYGGEAELRVNPMRGLDLSANIALIHSEVKDVTLPDGEVVSRKLPDAAPVQLTGLARYHWAFLDGDASVQADSKYVGGHYLTVLNEPINYQKGIATLNARIAWQTAAKNFEVSVYANNITGAYYKVWGLDVSALGIGMSVPGERGSYGARLRYNF